MRTHIADAYGDTSDLSEELVNTLCNLYYFAEKAQKLDYGGLSDLQELHPGKSTEALIILYTSHISHVAASVSHAPDMIKSMRLVRVKNPNVFSDHEQVTIDLLKYCIEGAEGKSSARRKRERKLKNPNEHQGLARRFNVPFRGAE